jgi:type VI secretion system protein ImpJ
LHWRGLLHAHTAYSEKPVRTRTQAYPDDAIKSRKFPTIFAGLFRRLFTLFHSGTLAAMQKLAPVIWARGTLLNPQHLQHQDRYLESLLQFRMRALHFSPYGFQTLRLDQDALASGAVALTEAAGIMPEGLVFDMPRSDAMPPLRAISPDMTFDVLDVHLAVPEYREGGANVTPRNTDEQVRYRAEPEFVLDESNDASEKPVMVARKNFRLLLGNESRQGYSTLRIAQVERTPGGLLRFRNQFIPPLLEMRASERLVSMGQRLVEILTGRSSALSGMRRQRNQSLADFTASDIPRFWLLYTINTFLPVFRHLVLTRAGHPEALFAAMLEIAGALTAFSDQVQPGELPAYDHDNLERCFTELDDKLRLLLETAVISNYVSLPLRLIERSVYATAIDRDEYLTNTRMYLAIRAEAPVPELMAKVPQLVKVASADVIDHLVQRALPGIQLRYVPDPPSAIPVQLDYLYFSLNQTGDQFERVRRARNLAAYVPDEFPHPEAELIIVLPQGHGSAG